MRKAIDLFTTYFPWVILAIFIADIFNFWYTDQERVLIEIVAAIGWASYLEIRKDYITLKNTIEGTVKNDA